MLKRSLAMTVAVAIMVLTGIIVPALASENPLFTSPAAPEPVAVVAAAPVSAPAPAVAKTADVAASTAAESDAPVVLLVTAEPAGATVTSRRGSGHAKPAARVAAPVASVRANKTVATQAAEADARNDEVTNDPAPVDEPTITTPEPPAQPSDLEVAQATLAELKNTYKYLDDVTVEMGTTPGGYQAVNYYTAGRIVISTSHTYPIRTILLHEIWHSIDYRDNGVIDWGENVAPRNAADYVK